ncbi:MAG: glycosyltransferase family 4 protein [Muribaculaceae bacterium]|nr:glycosyltransferase family 4 protein [Muribaculaceae bacterium]MDE5858196.1 glycosyltransferase family 4 protein [Muribaculaceae bacterium]
MTTSGNFKNVVFVGPSLDGRGGMEQLARLYKTHFNVLYLPTNSQYGTFVGFFILVFTCVRLPFYRFNHKILHIHVASGKSFFRKAFIVLCGRCLGYKIILHSHAGDLPQFVEKVGKPVAKSVFSMANLIIALSPYWKNYFENTLNCRNVVVVPNFSDAIHVDKKEKRDDKIHFLYLGVLTKEKGVDLLLKAYKDVSGRFPGKTRLVITGCGKLYRNLKEYAENEIKHGEVVFTGWVERERRDMLLNKADVVVLPSKFECQPMALIEAMAAGCGIVASRVGGIPDMIEDEVSGFLVDYGDIKNLSEAMVKYIESPDLISCHAASSRTRSNSYTSNEAATILKELYAEL